MPRAVSFAEFQTLPRRPKLWNAKRRIIASQNPSPNALYELKNNQYSETWRETVSKDVTDFIDQYEGRDSTGHPKREMLPEERLKLIRSPSQYFSRPQNVPLEFRQQVYFPDFTVSLLRSPHLGSYYASFSVPLWFGKLDLKSYLSNLYKVDTLHIRSYVIHQKPQRTPPAKKFNQGHKYRPQYKKKMTVQLVKPFMYPAEISQKELKGRNFESDTYWKSTIGFADEQRAQQDPVPKKADIGHRLSIADQARAILQGKDEWQPTWKQLAHSTKVMEGRKELPPPS